MMSPCSFQLFDNQYWTGVYHKSVPSYAVVRRIKTVTVTVLCRIFQKLQKISHNGHLCTKISIILAFLKTVWQSILNRSVSKECTKPRCCTPDISEAAKGFPQIPVVRWQANLQLVLRNTVGWFPISWVIWWKNCDHWFRSYFLNSEFFGTWKKSY